jgi:uncharacterized spore protein YtfJ
MLSSGRLLFCPATGASLRHVFLKKAAERQATMNDLEQLVRTTLAELRQLANTHSVVGEPIRVGDTTIIPLVRLSVGFGAGGGSGKRTEQGGMGGGTGGGAGVQPVAVLIVDAEGVRLEPVSGRSATAAEAINKIIDTIRTTLKQRMETAAQDRAE